jgi:Glycosyl hydrolases family 38 N-terminal domain
MSVYFKGREKSVIGTGTAAVSPAVPVRSVCLRIFALILFFLFSQLAGAQNSARSPESSIKTVYIVPTSHYDFGFVDPPEAIRERAARHIDEIIRVAESDPDFRWTIESVWQVNEWLKRAKTPTSVLPNDRTRIDRLMKLIKSGQIALSSAWGSMHTDFMGEEELNRLCYDYTALKRTYGVDTQMAMMDDVPGHPTTIPSVLARSGMRYLVTGANIFINTATSLAPGKVPFYWESPDGSRVLTWVSQGQRGGYPEGYTDFYLDPYSSDPYTGKTAYEMFNPKAGKKTDLQIMEEGVAVLQKRYGDAGYQYDAVMVLYAHDFVEPTNVANLERAVKLWNSQHDSPKLRIATPPDFFHYIEGKYAAQIPTYRGEWSGLWSEAKTSSPQISALARYAHDHTPAAETLWSAISATRGIPFPAGNTATLYDLMFTYDEHSGAGNTGWPQLNDRDKLDEQNRQYVGYMQRAKKEADILLNQGMQLLAQPARREVPQSLTSNSVWPLLVYNALSWRRDDLVTVVAPATGLKIVAIRKAGSNQSIPFDIDEQRRAVFVAQDLPSVGYAMFEVETTVGEMVSTLRDVPLARQAENKHFRLRFHPDGSVQSIVALASGQEIVNDKGELPFNQLLRVEGQEPSNIASPLPASIKIKRGVRMTRVTVTRERSAFPLTTLTIYDDLERVELHNEIDSASLPFAGGKNWHDSYYFAFPFAVGTQDLKVFRGGQKWFDRLPDDYLPGARRDSVTTQHLIGLSDGRSSVMLAHRQAFHFVFPSYVKARPSHQGAAAEFPALYTGKWPLPEATLYSRAFRRGNQADTHDLGVTNLATVEPGLGERYVFDYALDAASGNFDTVTAWRLGATFNVPLRALYVTAPPATSERSYFGVNQPNVEIVTVKQLADTTVHGEVSANPLDPKATRIFVIRLQEFAGRATTTEVSTPVKIRAAEILNLTEDSVVENITTLSPLVVKLKPYETVTLRIEIEPGL